MIFECELLEYLDFFVLSLNVTASDLKGYESYVFHKFSCEILTPSRHKHCLMIAIYFNRNVQLFLNVIRIYIVFYGVDVSLILVLETQRG